MKPAPAPATNPLTEGPLLAAILRLSWPMMLGNFLQTSSSIFDMIFVGRLGPDAIAGVSMSGAIIGLFTTDGLWYSFVITSGAEGLLKLFWFQRGKWKTRRV